MSDDELYVIQDGRQSVGNLVLWWGENRCGYTADFSQAGRYTKEEAEARHRDRPTDIYWPVSIVKPLIQHGVCMQQLRKLPKRKDSQ